MYLLVKKFYKFFLLFVFFLYFSINLIYGDRGYITLKSLENKQLLLEEQYAYLSKQQTELKNEVKLLRSDSLDKEMLDEYARKQLGYVRDDELILLIK